ncbi:MAG: type II secretion system protein M [Rhodocyclaceae bacterium]|nr:type II secretion system protein M [Rhodocyclaceae bacterium]
MSALTTIRQRLAAASPRERNALGLAGLVVGIGLLFSVGEWAYGERIRLAVRLPEAEARLARMQEQADELGRLKRTTAPADAPVVVRAAAARASAEARGLAIEVEALPDGIMISGSGAPGLVLDWLAALQAEQRLRPVELELVASEDGLDVDGRLLAVDSTTP